MSPGRAVLAAHSNPCSLRKRLGPANALMTRANTWLGRDVTWSSRHRVGTVQIKRFGGYEDARKRRSLGLRWWTTAPALLLPQASSSASPIILPVAISSRAQLFEVLGRGTFEELIGTPESHWLDFKKHPYLANDRGIRDLVADIAAFANSQGGAIVIGVHTKKLGGVRKEVADKVRGVNVELVVEDQVRRWLRSHIQPLVDIDIRRYQMTDPAKEIVAINVEPQPEQDRPCLVDRIVDRFDTRVVHAVGWPVRYGDETHWEDMLRIQALLAAGRRPVPVFAHSEESPAQVVADKQLEVLNRQGGWSDSPRIIVQAMPEYPTQPIPDFFGGFATKISRWGGFRPRGFDLGLDEGPLRRTGRFLVLASERRFVALDRSGVVTAAANGTPEMLGWAMGDAPSTSRGAVVANPYVVVEFPSELVRLVTEAIAPEVHARTWTYRVKGERLAQSTPLYLRPAPVHYRFVSEDREPLVDSFTEDVIGSGETWKDAFEVVAEIYGAAYGCNRDEIPWAEEGRINLGQM